jgi:CTP synthase (UTP-ammonia lyase)
MSQQAVLLDINQIGNLMADQPDKTKDSPATVQDLRNMGIAIDANFIVIRSEAKTESALLRSEMSEGFSKVRDEFAKLRTAAAYSLAVLLLAIIAIGISLGGLIINQS